MRIHQTAWIPVLSGLVLYSAGCARAKPSAEPTAETAAVASREDQARPSNNTAAGQKIQLPRPFATSSAVNGPDIVARPEGTLPKVPEGYRVALWTSDVTHPRNIVVGPNGDVFVVESRENRVRLFRNTDGDWSKPEQSTVFLEGLNQPFGLAFLGGHAYVGNTDAVVRVPYKPGTTRVTATPEKITTLTPGGYRQHWTRNVIPDPKNNRLFVSVGSRTNVDVEDPPRASILVMNPDGTGRREYAGGLRNPVGLAIHPQTGKLWTAVNERDGLGDDLPPDYVTEVQDGGFYGWPYAYIGPNEDPRRKGENPELVKKTIVPDVLVGAHTAALNMAFNPGTMFPGAGDAFVALHGSWNRSEPSGYKVIRIPMKDGRPSGVPQDFLWGFVVGNNRVWGRPVGVAFLPDGSLLMSEDGNDTIWRVWRG